MTADLPLRLPARRAMPCVGPREAAALAAVILAGAAVLGRHLGSASGEFDEQVYLASAALLSRGYSLGSAVFASQPPLFYGFLRAAARWTGDDPVRLRALAVALTLVGALAGWAVVRARAGKLAALVTAALLLTAPGIVDGAAVVSADVPSVALGTLALLAAQLGLRHLRWAVAGGALLACALLTKLLAVPFAAAILALAVVRRPPRRHVLGFLVGFAVVVAAVLVAYASALGSLWEGVVGLHLAARQTDIRFPTEPILGAVVMVALAYAGLLAIVAAGVLDGGRRALRAWARDHIDLVALVLAGVALCAVQRPLMAHHLVIVAWPLALLAGAALPERRRRGGRIALGVALAGGLLVLPWTVHGRPVVAPAEQSQLRAAAAVVARDTPPGATIVSDLPAVPLLAGRLPAATTVDPSYVRVETGELSAAAIERAALGVPAVVVGRAFTVVPGLTAALRAHFAHVRRIGPLTIFTGRRPPPAPTPPSPDHAAASAAGPPTPSAGDRRCGYLRTRAARAVPFAVSPPGEWQLRTGRRWRRPFAVLRGEGPGPGAGRLGHARIVPAPRSHEPAIHQCDSKPLAALRSTP